MATSWHATAIGKFTAAAWIGEMASVGFSGPGTDGGAWGAGHINSALEDFSATADGSNAVTTHFNANYGAVGTGAFSKVNQNTIAEAIWTFLNGCKVWQTPNFKWQEVRVSAINADGSVVNGASVYSMITQLAGGATTTNGAPVQTAIGISWQTGGRGPRNRGRIYMPMHNAPQLDGNGLVQVADQSIGRTTSKTLIDSINAIGSVRMSVVSRTHQTFSDIINVRTGDEPDTQRRRRNFRPEVYLSTAVTS